MLCSCRKFVIIMCVTRFAINWRKVCVTPWMASYVFFLCVKFTSKPFSIIYTLQHRETKNFAVNMLQTFWQIKTRQMFARQLLSKLKHTLPQSLAKRDFNIFGYLDLFIIFYEYIRHLIIKNKTYILHFISQKRKNILMN